MFKKKCIAHFSKKEKKAYVSIGGDFAISLFGSGWVK